MLRPVRRRVATVALVLLVPLLGACGFGAPDRSGLPAGRRHQRPPGTGRRARRRRGERESTASGTFVASLDNKNPRKAITLVSVEGSEGIEPQLVAPVKIEPGGHGQPRGHRRGPGQRRRGRAAGAFARLTLTFDTGQKSEVERTDRGQGRLLLPGQAGDPSSPAARPPPRRRPDAGSSDGALGSVSMSEPASRPAP